MSTDNQLAQSDSLHDALKMAFEQSESTAEVVETAEANDLPEVTETDEVIESEVTGELDEASELEESADESEAYVVPDELKSTYDYLKKEEKEAIAGLPAELQTKYLSRVKEQNRTFHEKTRNHADLVKVIEPFSDALARAGISPAQKVSQYIAIEQHLLTNPKEAILQLAKSYGVDLDMSDTEQSFDDPVQKEVSELRAKLDKLERSKLDEAQNSAQMQVKQFADTKNPDGSLKYPLFAKQSFKVAMSSKFDSGEAKTLEEAYKLVSDDLGINNQVQPIARKKSAKDARKLATGVHSKSASSVTAADGDSIRDTLRAQFKKFQTA